MTDLERRAEEYIEKNCDKWETDCLTVDEIVKCSLVEFATEATKDLVCEIGAKEEVIELQQKELEMQRHNADVRCDQAIESIKQLTKAKEIIKKFSEFANLEVEYDPEYPQEHTDLWNELCKEAEQFLKEGE